jgi:hypothetical protein
VTVTVEPMSEATTGMPYRPVGPPVAPLQRTGGLLTAGPIIDVSDEEAAAGIAYSIDCDCASDAITDFCNPPAPTEPGLPSILERDPVNIRVWSRWCWGRGRLDDTTRTNIVRAKLARVEATALEAALWGHPGLKQSFANATATPLTDTPVSPNCALSLLDQWAAAQCWPVVIHAPVSIDIATCCEGQMSLQGGRYITPIGAQVVLGGGYTGNGPGGVEPPTGQTWMFATGPVRLYRAEIHSDLGSDYTRNEYLDSAERIWIPDYACSTVAAVPVKCVSTLTTSALNAGRRVNLITGSDITTTTKVGP